MFGIRFENLLKSSNFESFDHAWYLTQLFGKNNLHELFRLLTIKETSIWKENRGFHATSLWTQLQLKLFMSKDYKSKTSSSFTDATKSLSFTTSDITWARNPNQDNVSEETLFCLDNLNEIETFKTEWQAGISGTMLFDIVKMFRKLFVEQREGLTGQLQIRHNYYG